MWCYTSESHVRGESVAHTRDDSLGNHPRYSAEISRIARLHYRFINLFEFVNPWKPPNGVFGVAIKTQDSGPLAVLDIQFRDHQSA